MEKQLFEEVRARLARNESPGQIRQALLEAGFSDADVNEAVNAQAAQQISEAASRDHRNARLFAARQVLDRVAFGTGAPQFMNILFYMTGASYFLLGVMNGAKAIISILFTTILQEYAHLHRVGKSLVSAGGVLFGFSFLLMAFAIRARSVSLFALGFLAATVGMVLYGDLFHKFVLETVRKEKMNRFLLRVGEYGILITMGSMLLGGWLLERYPEGMGQQVTVLGVPFTPIGYLLAFEITAFAFIISGYLMSFVKESRAERSYPLFAFIREHYKDLSVHASQFLKNKYTALLVAATVVTGLLELLGHSFYGLFIYETFKAHSFFGLPGGFLNVAILYSCAILASFVAPWFTRSVQRAIGLSPTLVFGTLLMAILPLTLVYNPVVFAVALALVLGVLGSAIVGLAQGLIARKLMGEETRKKYFMSTGVLVTIPYFVLVPLGALLAQRFGLEALFSLVGFGLVLVVTPLYFVLVLISSKQRL